MDFDFSPELKDLRDTARSFLADKCGPQSARRVLESADASDADAWCAMAEMGWLAATIPEEFGGLGLGHLAVCVLATELGRAIAPVPYSSSVYLATEAILLYGSDRQKRELLPQLADGSLVGTFAFVEQAGPFEPNRIRTGVRADRLSGTKTAVMDATIADFAVVAAHQADGTPALFLTDLSASTLTSTPLETIDPTRSHARLQFEEHPAELLPCSRTPGAIRRLLDRAAVMMAFEQLGVAEAALDMACAYAQERFAFGRPIGSFQAIKHKLADVYIAVELARSNCYFGAWALEKDAPDLAVAAAVARVSAGDAGWQATKENIQTHGGMGFTWEMDCHLYYRRAKLLGLALGSAREWKAKLMARLRTEAAGAAAA